MLSGQLKELDESLEAEQSKKAQLAMVKNRTRESPSWKERGGTGSEI